MDVADDAGAPLALKKERPFLLARKRLYYSQLFERNDDERTTK